LNVIEFFKFISTPAITHIYVYRVLLVTRVAYCFLNFVEDYVY